MKSHHIITIGRQYGSGGRIIGEKLAQKLGYKFYDKELITLASKESGLCKEFFEKADEKKKHGLFGGFLSMRLGVSMDNFVNNYLSNETLFKIQSDVIRELAEVEPCVFVGRCADYILRNQPNILNVFITADTADRIKHVKMYEKDNTLDDEKMIDLLQKTDKKRSGYYNYYTNKEWGVATSYHLCINSSVLGLDRTVEQINDFLNIKLQALNTN